MSLRTHRAELFVVGFALIATGLNLVWLLADRRNGALNIDEAGYIALALSDHREVTLHGLLSLPRFVMGQPVQPPLVTLLSAAAYAVTGGPTILGSFAVQLGSYAVMVVLSAFIARRLAGPLAGGVTAVVVASTPIALDYVHQYSFAIPAAAALTTAVWAALSSRSLTELRWSVLWGAALGAMVLSRSVTLAFIPAFVVLAAVQVLTAPNRRRSLAGCGVGVAAAALVAAPWYVAQGRSVFQYLTAYGYGSESVLYGPSHSPLSLSGWSVFLRVNIGEYLWLPLAAVLLAGALVLVERMAIAIVRRRRLTDLIASPWFFVAVIVLEGLLALDTSRNSGSGFLAPLVPCMVALAVAALLRRVTGKLAVILAAVIVLASLPPWLGKLPLRDASAQPVTAGVPGLGPVTVFDRTTAFDVYAQGELDPRDVGGTRWAAAGRAVVSDVQRLAGGGTAPIRVMFAFSNRMLNENSFRLYQDLATGEHADVSHLVAPDRTQPGYRTQMADLVGGARAFVLVRASPLGDFPPIRDAQTVTLAAQADGFTKRDSLQLPDGTSLDIWQR